MSKIQEIESALSQLPQQQQWEVAQWLLKELEVSADSENHTSEKNWVQSLALPDYAARRRRIFGDKVLPNMVLVARAEERW